MNAIMVIVAVLMNAIMVIVAVLMNAIMVICVPFIQAIYVYMCGGGGIVGKHVWVTVVACTCMLS